VYKGEREGEKEERKVAKGKKRKEKYSGEGM
jgi:hypothetical protein